MTAEEIKEIVRCGETSTVQFKLTFKKNEDIANELVAFSNSTFLLRGSLGIPQTQRVNLVNLSVIG